MSTVRMLPALVLAALAPAALAIDPAIEVEVVALEGQSVPGVGAITFVNNLAVNDAGTTLVEVDTDHPNGDADAVLLRDGVLYLREGQSLPQPAGASIGFFDTINLNAAGNSGWNFFLDGTSGSNDDSGIFFNTTLLIQEGQTATAPGFSPGTPFLGFFECKINNLDRILVLGTVDDPAITTSVDQFLLIVDPQTGQQTLFRKEGDPVPGTTGIFVSTFGTGPHNFAFNDAGQVLHYIDSDAPTGVDGFVLLDDTILAREGDPSPIAGRTWLSLSSPEVDLNEQGDTVFSGLLDGDSATNSIVVKNGQKFVQEGDTLPAIAPHKITSFGTGPILITDRHAADEDPDVLWYGDWDDPDTTRDTGVFLDDKLLVQEGVDQVAGLAVDTIASGQDGKAMSPNGRYILLEFQLAGSLDAAVLLDLGPWQNLGKALAGQTAPKLRGFGQLAAGQPVTLRLSRAPSNTTAALVIGASAVNAPFLGGTLVPFPDVVVAGLPTGPDGILELTGTWPAGVPAGVKVWFQYWVQDPAGPFGHSASNAIVGTSQ